MTTFSYSGDEVLDIMSRHTPNRSRYIEKLIAENLKFDSLSKGVKILEFGAGKGEFILRFVGRKEFGFYAVELDSVYRKNLSTHVVVYGSIEEIPEKVDCIYLIDVLEHLEDDVSYIRKFYSKLKAGGRIFIYTPARMELYSPFDERIHHFRRYSLQELKSKVEEAGFIIEVAKYHEFLGYFAVWLNKLVSRKAKLNVTAAKMYDSILVPATNFLEKFITAPVGKSVYVTAIRKA